MPRELSPSEERAFARYEVLGTPEEVQKAISENEKLKRENAERRQENRTLADQVSALSMPEGGKVLSPDEAKAWDAYTALGTPEEQAKRAEDFKRLEVKDAERTRLDSMKAAVAAERFPEGAAELLADSKRADGATYSVAKEKVRDASGKEVESEVGYITLAGDGQKPMRLADFAKANLPALLSLGAAGNGGGTSRAAPEQRGGGSPAASTASTLLERAKEANKQRADAPNPLRPAPATT